MEEITIQNVRILDPQSSYHNKVVDVQLVKSKIVKIGTIKDSSNSIDGSNCILTRGFIDLRAFAQDPGEEYKEDLGSLMRAGLAGGFTEVCLHPYDANSLQCKQDIEYVENFNEINPIQYHCIATCTANLEGKEISEMYDLKTSGAKGFSNGNNSIAHAGVMNRVMQYVSNIDARLFIHAQLDYLALNWQVNEGENNVKTGLKGLPDVAEHIVLRRDIELAKYNGTKIHFSHISSAKSVELIREAKAEGVDVTCDTAIMNVLFTDKNILGFDSNYKTNPPLRSKEDQDALINGLKDGTIDGICSDHLAQDRESKIVEFNHAEHGVNSIQWTFPKAYEALSKVIGEDKTIELFTSRPSQVIHNNYSPIEDGANGSLTLFNPETEWVLDKNNNASKSINSPFNELNIKGKVIGVYSKGIWKNL